MPTKPPFPGPSTRDPMHDVHIGPASMAVGNSDLIPKSGCCRRLAEARGTGIRPHNRGAISLGKRAVGHPPGQRGAQGGLVSPPFHHPQGFSRQRAGLASTGRGRLACRRLGKWSEGRRTRRRIYADRSGYFRRRESRERKRVGCSSVRPDRSRTCPPASRWAGTPPARASGRPSGSRPGPKPTSPASTSPQRIQPAKIRVRGRAWPVSTREVPAQPRANDTEVDQPVTFSRDRPVQVDDACQDGPCHDGIAGPRPQALVTRKIPTFTT